MDQRHTDHPHNSKGHECAALVFEDMHSPSDHSDRAVSTAALHASNVSRYGGLRHQPVRRESRGASAASEELSCQRRPAPGKPSHRVMQIKVAMPSIAIRSRVRLALAANMCCGIVNVKVVLAPSVGPPERRSLQRSR